MIVILAILFCSESTCFFNFFAEKEDFIQNHITHTTQQTTHKLEPSNTPKNIIHGH